MKNKEQQLLLDIALQNKDIIYKDNKILAKLNWLEEWKKNPRVIDKSNFEKLKKQIKELSVYKPLVVAMEGDKGVVLGGNQRLKVLKELVKNDKKYEYVWISLVEAPDDVNKIKYALSDNFSAGEYTKEKLQEIIKIDQLGLFDNYDISFEEKKTLQQFVDELAIPENELIFKNIKDNLHKLGINDEAIQVLKTMVQFNKNLEILEDVDIKGSIKGEKFPIMFWFEDEITFNQVKKLFELPHKKYEQNTDLFIKMIEEKWSFKLPTTEKEIEKIIFDLKELDINIKDFKKIEEDTNNLTLKREELKTKYKELFLKLFPEEIINL